MNAAVQAAAPKKVTIIPCDPQLAERDIRKKHLRVAPYCRVSTDKEEQLSSYEAQIEYYTDKINSNPDWTMVRLYADEGITGTSARKRKDFLKMVRDCQKGKIDLVITKSVSRFCRNTLDGLNYVRRLKQYGVGVYFEKENVNTLYMDNEMILTFMMSQAQAESESLSGNVKWGHRKNFQDGKVYYNYKGFLGYRRGADGRPEIDPEQAAVVRRIFSRYLLGHSVRQIVTDLMADGIKTATGKEIWHDSVIQKMLCNEKYIGDALLQKTYIADLFSKEKRVNNGELPKYYVHDCHPAIIDRETFMKAKQLRLSRKQCPARICEGDILRKRLRCGICGGPFRSIYGRNTHSYECQAKNRGSKKCTSLRTSETQLQQAFLRLYFKLKRHGESVLTQLITDLRTARNGSLLWSEGVVELNKQITDIAGQERLLLLLKQQGAVDPDLFLSRSDQLAEQRRTAKLKKERLLRSEEDHTIQRTQDLLDYLRSGPDTLSFFDEALFSELVEKIIVTDNETLRFRLINGLELTETIERTKR